MVASCSQPSPEEKPPISAAEQEKRDSLYAVGAWLARNLAGIKIHEEDLAPIEEGLSDALLRRPLRVDPVDVGERVQKLLNDAARRDRRRGEARRRAASSTRRSSEPRRASARVSGLVYLSLVEGTGDPPQLTDRVKLHYRGTRRDGSTLDDSFERGSAREVRR